MLFYNDECDLVDDERYDMFTFTILLQRHTGAPREQTRPRQPNRAPLRGCHDGRQRQR